MMPTYWGQLSFEGVRWPILWGIGLVVGVLFLLWTYWGIFQRSARSLAWLLFGIRLAGLLALLLILAKPTLTREPLTIEPGRIAVVVDNSLSMTLADASGTSRYERVRQAVTQLRRAIDTQASAPATVLDFYDITGQPLAANQLPAEAQVGYSDLGRAVRQAVAASRSKPLTAVVLLSDGSDTTSRTDFRDLAELPVPVFTVGFPRDDSAGVFDLAIRKPSLPTQALLNNELLLEVPLRKIGPAANAKLTLYRGTTVIAEQEVDFDATTAEKNVRLKFTPTEVGTFYYTLTVRSPTAEHNRLNNSVSFPLEVIGEPIRVLYLEGFLRFESSFLIELLKDDRDVALETLIRRASPEIIAVRPVPEPLTAEKLKKVDVVILGDMEGSFLAEAEYEALLKWLDEKNHALLVLGGYKSFGSEGWKATPLAKALPVVFAPSEPTQHEANFVLRLTEEGKRHPIFQISGNRVEDEEFWNQHGELTGLALVAQAKPAATVLAEHPTLQVAGKPAIVAAWQPYSSGKTMVLTIDSTWRWSRLARLMGKPDTAYRKFWSQTIRWLGGRGLDEQKPLLTISTDQPTYAPGQTVTVTAKRQARAGSDLSQTRWTIEAGDNIPSLDGKPIDPATLRSRSFVSLRQADGQLFALEVQASSSAPDEFVGSFVPPQAGRYTVLGQLTLDGKPLGNQAAEFVVQGRELELENPEPNPSQLEAIRLATGGKYYDIANFEALAHDLPRREKKLLRVERREFWNSPWLFGFFVVAVSTEWLLRRRNHLV